MSSTKMPRRGYPIPIKAKHTTGNPYGAIPEFITIYYKQVAPLGHIFLLLTLFFGLSTSLYAQNLKLWYKQPAQKWTDALPIGNGRLGGMVFGGVNEDRIQFNENTLWTGGPRQYQRDGAYRYLPQIRKLIAEGKQKEAEALALNHFMGKRSNEQTYSADSLGWVMDMQKLPVPTATETWKTILLPIEQGWEITPGFEGLDGAVWFTKEFEVPADWKGKSLTLSLGRVRDMDITYVNGKQVGSTSGTAYRKYAIPATALRIGKNTISVLVFNFNDKGGLTSKAEELVMYPEGVSMDTFTEQGTKETTLVPIDTKTKSIAKALRLKGEWKYHIQNSNPPAFPQYNAAYQPFADLYFQYPDKGAVTAYRRDLDITNATAHVEYLQNNIKYTREYFVSAPDQVMAIKLTASEVSKLDVKALFKTLHKQYSIRKVDENTLAISLKVKDGVLKGVSYLHVVYGAGKVKVSTDGIDIKGATAVMFYLTAATNYKNYHDVSGNPEAIVKQQQARLTNKSYAGIKAAHVADYQKYFNTFSIDLGHTTSENLPTDERILQFSKSPDPSFVSLYTQYGRYLFISSSRPGYQPANLQGIWNDLLTPPWGSKYTTNINLQMNYWIAEPLNLSALSEPFFSIVDDLTKTGIATAREHYDSPGWVLHHNTDLWRGTAPVNASNHGIWQPGAAWLSHQMWEHYQFTHDENFLRARAWPAMKGAAEFFVHTLVKDPKTGYLISTPSNSPEHGGLVAGPTMDHQIIRELFKDCINAAQVLGIDKSFADTLKSMSAQIAPNKIGKFGQLQEWLEDKDDTTDTHRHVSHMWGVYPGTEINLKTPDLLRAAQKSMYYRGDEGTGWSIAWKVNIWARMHQGDHAYLSFSKLLSPADVTSGKEKGGVYHNLFDAHPPFQIDGNFGGAAGLSEMLIQSQSDGIELLPALPTALPDGTVKGLCARGGFVVDLVWKQGVLQQVKVLSKSGLVCKLLYKDKVVSVPTVKGKTYTFNGMLEAL